MRQDNVELTVTYRNVVLRINVQRWHLVFRTARWGKSSDWLTDAAQQEEINTNVARCFAPPLEGTPFRYRREERRSKQLSSRRQERHSTPPGDEQASLGLLGSIPSSRQEPRVAAAGDSVSRTHVAYIRHLVLRLHAAFSLRTSQLPNNN